MPLFLVLTREGELDPIDWKRKVAVIQAEDMDGARKIVQRGWFGFTLNPLTLHESERGGRYRIFKEEMVQSVTIYEIASVLLNGVDYGPGVDVMDVPTTFQKLTDILDQHPYQTA